MPPPLSGFLASAQPQGERSTRTGPVALPIVYRDASVANLVFRVPPAGVASALGSLRLHPVSIAGKTTVVLTIFEYRDTSIGPYNELAVTSYVRQPGSRGLGGAAFWVHALPVTTEVACAAGLDIWGYPKWVTPIDYVREGGVVRAALPGELTLDMAIGGMPAVPVKAPFTTFTEFQGGLLRTRVHSRSQMRFVRSSRADLRVHGTGRVAALLDALGCLGRRPVLAFWCERFESILPAGEPAGAARDASHEETPAGASARRRVS